MLLLVVAGVGEASGGAPDCGELREMHGLASFPEAHSRIHKASCYLLQSLWPMIEMLCKRSGSTDSILFC